MLYGIRGCTDPALAYIAGVSYWVYSCRKLSVTPCKDLGKWTYLESAIRQSAMMSETVEEYISALAGRLKSFQPILSRYSQMLTHEENDRVILMASKTDTGLTDIREMEPGQPLPMFVSPTELLQDLLAQGYREAEVVKLACKSFIIVMHCQVAEKVHGWKPAEEEDAVEVEVSA